MPSRTQLTLDPDLDRRAKARAAALGITFAEYVRRLIRTDLGEGAGRRPISTLFGAGASGGSHVARHKDQYLGEAFDQGFADPGPRGTRGRPASSAE